MKKIIFIIILLCGFYNMSQAQLFWKVSGNNLKKPSYILGTSHFTSVTFCDSISGFKKAFNSTKQFYGEVSSADLANIEASMKIQKMELLPDNQSLADFYTPEEYEQILQYTESILGYRPGMITFTPNALYLFFTAQLYLKYLPQSLETEFIDMGLAQMAKEAGKQIGGLETAESQIDLLWGGDLKEQAAQLLEYIQDPASSKDSIVNECLRIDKAYRDQDLNQLSLMIKQSFNPEEYKECITDRNVAWIPIMEEAMKKYSTFFAVGAGHLVDEVGLIRLLREKGYTVEPVKK